MDTADMEMRRLDCFARKVLDELYKAHMLSPTHNLSAQLFSPEAVSVAHTMKKASSSASKGLSPNSLWYT